MVILFFGRLFKCSMKTTWFNPDARLQDPADILRNTNHVCANASSCGSAAIPTMFCFERGTGKALRETDQWGFCLQAYLKHLKET